MTSPQAQRKTFDVLLPNRSYKGSPSPKGMPVHKINGARSDIQMS